MTILSKQGEIIYYGNEVNLIHKDSSRILGITGKASDKEKGSMRVKLFSQGVPEDVDFQILSRYKYKQIGDRVVFGDHIMLFNPKFGMYIHVSTVNMMNPSGLNQIRIDYRPTLRIEKSLPEDMYDRYAINASFAMAKSKFIINKFISAANDLNTYLKGGDIIRMKHTEKGSYMFCDGSNIDVNG